MQQSDTHLIPLEAIEHRIHVVRGLKVMLDKDLAELYQVPTKRLNEQVKRNGNRFPLDFMFQLSEEEAAALRSHSATSKTGRGGRRYGCDCFKLCRLQFHQDSSYTPHIPGHSC